LVSSQSSDWHSAGQNGTASFETGLSREIIFRKCALEHKFERPLTVAILALGGQGGGVLTKWLVDIAQSNGFLAQSTYVAGVAQRTGATVYCVELFPERLLGESGREPVFTTYPVPGDVDLVVAGEFAETGRAIQKGFVTPNITTLIASTHRVYSITEKSALGDGIIDQAPVAEVAARVAKKFIAFDMAEHADQAKSVISAVMLGAIAASRALPFEREAFEAAIHASGKAVAANLAGFQAGFEQGSQTTATLGAATARAGKTVTMPTAEGPNGKALLERIRSELPPSLQAIAAHGALRALDYQDAAYAGLYLDRLKQVIQYEQSLATEPQDGAGRFPISSEVARELALQMCYEDTIRVAEIKTSGQRMRGVRSHLNVNQQQPAHVVEYFHPRFEELCDTLPRSLGQHMLHSKLARRCLQPFLRKGRNITTTNVVGYLQLALLARLKRWRRGTLRFATQNELIGEWLRRVQSAAHSDYSLAIAQCVGMVKGYGDTYERGLHRYQQILAAVQDLPPAQAAALTRQLYQAAQADEEGKVFAEALNKVRLENNGG
jgi:indolepyruvate ferredoxin oxidoreductase beta subunit